METGTVDLLHIAFGGLGGHAAVVGPLSAIMRKTGIRSGVLTYAPASDLAANAHAWSELDVVAPVPLGGRFDLRGMRRVAAVVRRLRPRVILCHTHKPVVAAFAGAVASGRLPRLLLVEHQAIDLRACADDILSAVALPLVRGVVVNQDDYARRYRFKHLPLPALKRLAVVPNGVDTEVFAPTCDGGPESAGAVIGMATRLTPTKDLPSLIRAVSRLRERSGSRPVRLEIAGDGPQREALELLVKDLGLSEHVRLLGALERPDLVAFLRRLDLYVQSTLGETACTAVLQAWAVGKPVVASDVTGVHDLVLNGVDGVLVPPEDPAALADALAALLEDPARRAELVACGQRRVQEEFDTRLTTARYRAVLRAIDPSGPW